ncbi:MAG: hypothetical protein OER12_03090 [Acidimicrobiia bacterium]|nr:hypothetical protein [Acidimicrobiia bacterium]
MKQQRFDRAVVLLDSSSSDGDDGASLAASLLGADGHLTLAVSLSGPEAWGVSAFADSEALSISDAATVYLKQVTERLDHPQISTTMVDGAELTAELIAMVEESDADVLVLPAPWAVRIMATKRSWAALSFPVVVVPARPSAA